MSERDDQEQEPDFQKVDRRHQAEPEPAESAPEAEQSSPAEVPEEPTAGEPEPMSLAELGVYALLRFSLGLFVQQAWINLGIQKAPGANEVKTELNQARTAIETVRVLAAQLDPDMDVSERREVESIISNLQINFVQRSAQPSA